MWAAVISQFGGTQSFLNFSLFSGTQSFLKHFSIWWTTVISKTWWNSHISIRWNTVISQFRGSQSFLNFMEHSHFLIWWKHVKWPPSDLTPWTLTLRNTVISQFHGTQSFLKSQLGYEVSKFFFRGRLLILSILCFTLDKVNLNGFLIVF